MEEVRGIGATLAPQSEMMQVSIAEEDEEEMKSKENIGGKRLFEIGPQMIRKTVTGFSQNQIVSMDNLSSASQFKPGHMHATPESRCCSEFDISDAINCCTYAPRSRNQRTKEVSNVCNANENFEGDLPGGKDFAWDKDSRLLLKCNPIVIPVPIVQEVHRRDKIIEVPQIDVVHALVPKIYSQGVNHDIPLMRLNVRHPIPGNGENNIQQTDQVEELKKSISSSIRNLSSFFSSFSEQSDDEPRNVMKPEHIPESGMRKIEIPRVTYVDKEVVVPIVTGYIHRFVPKWEIREVPRPVIKYVGKQEEISIDIPQVQFVDKVIEREFVVDTVSKRVPKIIEIPKYVDTVKYVWKPVEKLVHIERYVPKFDVDLHCPTPLIVPFCIKNFKTLPPILIKNSPNGLSLINLPEKYIANKSSYSSNPSDLSVSSQVAKTVPPCH